MILLQEYNGKGIKNNRVHIDYEQQTVFFEPADHRSNLLLFFLDVFNVFFNAFMFSFIFMCVVFRLANYFLSIFVLFLITLIATTAATFALLAQLGKWCSPLWRKRMFPIWNTILRRKKKRVIRSEAIVNNKFVLPWFYNMVLEYKTTGEYSEYLSRVDIDNIFEGRGTHWFVVFTFTHQPRVGTFEVNYI